jgi:hypothetical protein
MNLPFPIFTLVHAGTGVSGAGFEVHLNRSGINSIDLPREKVSVEPGNGLRLVFSNHGAPIHITVTTSNAGMYTDFFHENMYVVDESVLLIPVRKDCEEGFFDLEIISGYGVMKTLMRVNVAHVPPPRPTIQEEFPLQPVAHGRPHLLMVMMGVALILYTTWLYTKTEFLNIASFIILIVGALYTWYRQQ